MVSEVGDSNLSQILCLIDSNQGPRMRLAFAVDHRHVGCVCYDVGIRDHVTLVVNQEAGALRRTGLKRVAFTVTTADSVLLTIALTVRGGGVVGDQGR